MKSRFAMHPFQQDFRYWSSLFSVCVCGSDEEVDHYYCTSFHQAHLRIQRHWPYASTKCPHHRWGNQLSFQGVLDMHLGISISICVGWWDDVFCSRQAACQLAKSGFLFLDSISLLVLLWLHLCLHPYDTRGDDLTRSSIWCCRGYAWQGVEVMFLLLSVGWPGADDTMLDGSMHNQRV